MQGQCVSTEAGVRSPQRPGADEVESSLEQIARAVVGPHHHAADVLAREARALLDCDVALLLTPTEAHGGAAIAGIAGVQEERLNRGALLSLGPRAPEILDRISHTSDGWRQPWVGLDLRLREHGIRAWAGMPLRGEKGQPLGLLVPGSRRGPRPCGRMDRLHHVARSCSAALSCAPQRPAPEEPSVPADLPYLQTVSNLTFGVSHTLANVFGAILGNLHFLREEFHGVVSEDLLERLQSSTCEGIELMRSLQAFSGGVVERSMGPVDLAQLATGVVALIRDLYAHWPESRGISLKVDARDPVFVWGDAGQLRQVLVNLIFNAINAAVTDGAVVVRAANSGSSGELAICDNGRGMSNEVLRRSTEPFFTTNPEHHQGLGLTVARGLAVGHRGSLKIAWGEPRGVKVVMRLPTEPPAPDRAERTLAKAAPSFSSDRKGALQ